jgi:hypothetical protein
MNIKSKASKLRLRSSIARWISVTTAATVVPSRRQPARTRDVFANWRERRERRKTWGDSIGKRGRRGEGKRDISCPFSFLMLAKWIFNFNGCCVH